MDLRKLSRTKNGYHTYKKAGWKSTFLKYKEKVKKEEELEKRQVMEYLKEKYN